jgi:SAM-dependent methyltransferase
MIKDGTSPVAYWDRVATEKCFSHPLRLNWLARYLGQEARILDVGCGYGRTLAELSGAGYRNTVGTDFSAGMLERCRKQVDDTRLILNDGQALPVQSDSCDAVLLFAVLTCVPDSVEQRALITEALRVLRRGGLIYVSDLLVNSDRRNRERYEEHLSAFNCYGVFELPEGVVVRHHTKAWIDELLAPFEKLEYERFNVLTMNGNESAAFQYLGRKVS